MIRFGQKIIGRNVQTRFLRFGHWPKRKKKMLLLASIFIFIRFGQLFVFGQMFFFRPKNFLKFVRLNWHLIFLIVTLFHNSFGPVAIVSDPHSLRVHPWNPPFLSWLAIVLGVATQKTLKAKKGGMLLFRALGGL
jgi:hypothetical protein